MSQLDHDGYGDEVAGCIGKRRFRPEDRAEAAKQARHLNNRSKGGQTVAYRCPYCHGWHIGRQVKDPKALALRQQRALVPAPSQPPEACHGEPRQDHRPRAL